MLDIVFWWFHKFHKFKFVLVAKESEKTPEVEKEKAEVEDATPKPRALHKTLSIFLRNLAPSITKQEVEAVSFAAAVSTYLFNPSMNSWSSLVSVLSCVQRSQFVSPANENTHPYDVSVAGMVRCGQLEASFWPHSCLLFE